MATVSVPKDDSEKTTLSMKRQARHSWTRKRDFFTANWLKNGLLPLKVSLIAKEKEAKKRRRCIDYNDPIEPDIIPAIFVEDKLMGGKVGDRGHTYFVTPLATRPWEVGSSSLKIRFSMGNRERKW